MTDKVTLTNLANLQNETTAVNAINANNAAITTAMDNTLSRDGTSPNQMGASLDMNSNNIINLPAATATGEPITYEIFNAAVIGKGNVPLGGTTGQLLKKNSNTDYDSVWSSESSELIAGNNITITGTSPATIALTTPLSLPSNQNSPYGINVSNSNAGTAALASLTASNDLGLTVGATTFGTTSSVYTTVPVLTNRGFVYSGSSLSGLALVTGAASTNIVFGINNLQVGSWSSVQPGRLSAGNLANAITGQFTLVGATSGQLNQTIPDALGASPTVTWGNSSGTPAVTATSPLALSTTTGNIALTLGAANSVMVMNAGGTSASFSTANLGSTNAFTGTLAATFFPALTGDITTSAGSLATTLATVATAGTTGSSTAIPVITINAKGLTTSITTAAVIAPAGTLTGTALASNVVTSSLTSVGTLAGLTVTGSFTATGLVTNADLANSTITLGSTSMALGSTNTTIAGAITWSGSPTFSSAITYGGVTLSNAVTGTGNMVLSASPTLSGTVGGALTFSGALTLSSALTYGGVTLSNAVTGTGNMVLATSPTITTPTITTSITVPLIAGGSAASSTLTLESTSGAGTTDSIIFQTGSQVFAGSINTSQQWIHGTNHAPASGVILTVSKNAASLPAATGPTVLAQFGSVDSTQSMVLVDGFGGVGKQPFYALRNARGTAASPTALLSGDQLGFVGMTGATGAGTYAASDGSAGGVFFGGYTTENWSGTNQGSEIRIYTTPNTTAAVAIAARFQNSGGLSVGTATDPGVGSIYANASLSSGITSSSSTFLNLAAATTAKSSLRVASGTAPTSPVDGDIWYDGTNIKIRVGGTTKTFTIV